MENEFAKVMSEKSDDDLIKIVTAERDKYNLTAIEAAESEIEARAIDTSTFEEIKKTATKERIAADKVESSIVGSGTRFLNYGIDSTVLIILTFIVIVIIGLVFNEALRSLLPLLSLFIFLVIFFAYYAFMEIKYQKTIGKFMTKTKVVTANGDKPTDTDILMRTFCRLIPFDRFTFIFMENGIHDTLSKTKVIKDATPD